MGLVGTAIGIGVGGASGFSPRSLSGLVMWLTSRAGASASAWSDQSGQGNNATGGGGAANPTFSASDANWHNQPSLTFSAGQFMSITSAPSLQITGPLTIVAAVRSTNTTGFNTLISKGASSCEFDSYFVSGGCVGVRGSTQTFGMAPLVQNVSSSFIWTTDQSSVQAGYINGVSQSLGTNLFNAGISSGNQVRIGMRGDAGTQLIGSAVEFMLYNRLLSASDVSMLYGYQKSVWGLP
jgi:hypothetical protein